MPRDTGESHVARVEELEAENRKLQHELEGLWRLEESARRGEQRLRELIDGSGSFISQVDAEGRFSFVNRAAEQVLGLPPLQCIGLYAADFVHPADREASSRLSRQWIAERRRNVSHEARVVSRDGTVRHLLASLELSYDEDGGLRHVSSIARDMTEQRRAEKALRGSEHKYRTLVDNLNVGVFRVEPGDGGRLLFANQSLLRITGYPSLEAANERPFADHFVRPHDRATLVDLAAKREGEVDIPLELKLPDGTTHWVSCSVVAARGPDGRVLHVDGILEDITDRKRAEEAILESEERFRMLADATFEGLCIIAPGGRLLVDANRQLAEMLGYSLDALLRQDVLDLVAPESRDVIRGRLERPSDVPAEIVLQRRDGTTLAAEIHGRWMPREGRQVRVVAVRDITERRRVEQLQESLRRSETLSAMGRLVGGVAHEVRNPLFAISATLDAFDEDFTGHPEYQEYAGLLRAEVNRLQRLMQDLFDYGRPVAAVFAASDLGSMLEEAMRQCRGEAEDGGVTIGVEPHATLPEIEMDRSRLHHVFANVVKNAVAHTPSGGSVRLVAEPFEEAGQSWLRCRVEDTGGGFAEDDIPRLFEPFFSRRKGGTGLGLSIVQRVVHEHAGRVWAGNRPEGGAVVTVELPCRRPKPPSGSAGPAS